MNHESKIGDDPAMQKNLARYYEVAKGLAYLHTRTNATSERTFEAASFVYALIKLLAEKGLLDIMELLGGEI